MIRNSDKKIVDEKGNEVFKSEVFRGLSSVDNLVQVCPNTIYLDKQAQAAYLVFPDECRKFVEYHSSKLIDDNYSLASVEAKGEQYFDDTKHREYINNIICFLALTNKIASVETKAKNDILGGTFPTKNDNSADSMVPMYLCVEMLKGKCRNDLNTPINSLDNYDVTGKVNIPKNSTLGQEFDKVIGKLKQLNYDKSYFHTNINEEAMNYIANCQVSNSQIKEIVDPDGIVKKVKEDGMVDIYAKCEEDKCVLYVAQKLEQGDISNNVTMFTIENKKEVANNSQVVLPSISGIEKPVIPLQNNVTEEIGNTQETTVAKEEPKKDVLAILESASKLIECANRLSGNKFNDVKSNLDKNIIHYQNESRFKGTPEEKKLKEMMANQQQVQQPVISINSSMFR